MSVLSDKNDSVSLQVGRIRDPFDYLARTMNVGGKALSEHLNDIELLNHQGFPTVHCYTEVASTDGLILFDEFLGKPFWVITSKHFLRFSNAVEHVENKL